MHWTICGANASIALRRSKLSGRYEDFWSAARTGQPRDGYPKTDVHPV
jgi:hypothetical protein